MDRLIQLPLAVSLPKEYRLDNFIFQKRGPSPENIADFIHSSDAGTLLLFGNQGVGKSHLLQAVIAACQAQGQMIIGLEDIDRKLGDLDAEKALFHLYNQAITENKKLVLSMAHSPFKTHFALPDLKSRCCQSLIFHLYPLPDTVLINAIAADAKAKGLSLSLPTARYLLTHYSRSLPELMSLLNTLDPMTLSEKRQLTIPYLKEKLKSLKNNT
jgi:DnaA family protein